MKAERVTGAIVLLLLVGIGNPTSALADCDGTAPRFSLVASSADRVVVGTVVAVHPSRYSYGEGRSLNFRLVVERVLKGKQVRELEIHDLPLNPCTDHLVARVDDKIAIAFNALDEYAPPLRVNAVAWLDGEPVNSSVESLSLAEVYAALGLELPDTSTLPAEDADATGPWFGVALGLFWTGMLLGLRRTASSPR